VRPGTGCSNRVDQLNAASRLYRFRSGSLPASVAARFRLRYIAGKAHRRHHRYRRTCLPKAARDGFRTPSRNPRRESISSVTHRRDQRLIPVKIRPDVSAFLAARLAGKLGLNVRQPDVIRPLIAADRGRMAAAIMRAIDQNAANARCAHLSEGDLLRAGEGGHAPLKRTREAGANSPGFGQNVRR
jgi:hypothetical protein